MKKFVYAALVTCAVLSFSSVIPSPASAGEGDATYYAQHTTMPVTAGNVPLASGSFAVPTRFGNLVVHEQNFGNSRRYVVTYNDNPVLNADNQLTPLQALQAVQLENEDAIIFTASNADPMCPFRNYLVITSPNGLPVTPREIENCANAAESRMSVIHNALFMAFVNTSPMSQWDVWRYENTSLVRL